MPALIIVISQKAHLDLVARNEYLANDARDPTACSLLYFSLGKVKLVHGLWRQAAWHKEQSATLKFLSNDFSQPRWKTAALKNAYALLGKQRYGKNDCLGALHILTYEQSMQHRFSSWEAHSRTQ